MDNKPKIISYGPHLFPGGPERYIRSVNSFSRLGNHHQDIKETLVEAFNYQNPHSITHQITKKVKIDPETPINISFLNWGNMELVYLISIGNNYKLTALINQPHTGLGKVKNEFENLQRLGEIDSKFVVQPSAHFALNNHELYVSEYIPYARCIYGGRSNSGFGTSGWGMFDPVPQYHFKEFSADIEKEVTTNMIALLVRYYDEKNSRGIAKTQIAGDDFILTRDFTPDHSSSVLPNMKLIAARDFVQASLEEYIELIEKEFQQGTHYTDADVFSGRFKVNYKSGLALSKQEIDNGIELGLRLRMKK